MATYQGRGINENGEGGGGGDFKAARGAMHRVKEVSGDVFGGSASSGEDRIGDTRRPGEVMVKLKFG